LWKTVKVFCVSCQGEGLVVRSWYKYQINIAKGEIVPRFYSTYDWQLHVLAEG